MKKITLAFAISLSSLLCYSQTKTQTIPKTQTDSTLYQMQYNWTQMEKQRKRALMFGLGSVGLGAYGIYTNNLGDNRTTAASARGFLTASALSGFVGLIIYVDSFKWLEKNVELSPTGLVIKF